MLHRHFRHTLCRFLLPASFFMSSPIDGTTCPSKVSATIGAFRDVRLERRWSLPLTGSRRCRGSAIEAHCQFFLRRAPGRRITTMTTRNLSAKLRSLTLTSRRWRHSDFRGLNAPAGRTGAVNAALDSLRRSWWMRSSTRTCGLLLPHSRYCDISRAAAWLASMIRPKLLIVHPCFNARGAAVTYVSRYVPLMLRARSLAVTLRVKVTLHMMARRVTVLNVHARRERSPHPPTPSFLATPLATLRSARARPSSRWCHGNTFDLDISAARPPIPRAPAASSPPHRGWPAVSAPEHVERRLRCLVSGRTRRLLFAGSTGHGGAARSLLALSRRHFAGENTPQRHDARLPRVAMEMSQMGCKAVEEGRRMQTRRVLGALRILHGALFPMRTEDAAAPAPLELWSGVLYSRQLHIMSLAYVSPKDTARIFAPQLHLRLLDVKRVRCVPLV
ncbi:hypothetical protein C8J57DRAFT_1479392 [Mycena rebaudengoi]|nr:hypothetical protein C8J57DRAFT_1479392 [Mycena rebaudengoi]